VAKGNHPPRGVAASDSLPLFPPDVSDRSVSGRKEVANVVPIHVRRVQLRRTSRGRQWPISPQGPQARRSSSA
jgi:hypothetical protein